MRTFGRDGYEVNGVVKRAYSTYIELGYDFDLGENWSLVARVGITPANSLYTGYRGDFAVSLVGLKLNKNWVLGDEMKDAKRVGRLNAFAHVMLQPWQVNKDNLIKPIMEAGNQKLNVAVGCSYGI
jgi:hypothetical protein